MLINILWHLLGANQFGERDLFLAAAKHYGIVFLLNQSQQSISPCFGDQSKNVRGWPHPHRRWRSTPRTLIFETHLIFIQKPLNKGRKIRPVDSSGAARHLKYGRKATSGLVQQEIYRKECLSYQRQVSSGWRGATTEQCMCLDRPTAADVTSCQRWISIATHSKPKHPHHL